MKPQSNTSTNTFVPMVIALVATDNIFTPDGLNAVTAVTNAVIKLANVDPEGVTSLATENNIVGTSDGMDVSPFFEKVN